MPAKARQQPPSYLRSSPEIPTTYIKFFASVNAQTVGRLLQVVTEGLRTGSKRFVILISSPGGSVFHGLSAHNFLKGIPAEVITHNFGSVDSIGVVLYCAGSTRLSVPHARFLLHGVSLQFPQGASLEEPQLVERLKGLLIDVENIAGVVAATCEKEEAEIKAKMLDRTTLSPEEAQEWGLVHEIRESLFPEGVTPLSIDDGQAQGFGGQLPPQLQTLIQQAPVIRAEVN
jgi:ATP-dependent protease ClpP protease subunit